ncbi:ComEC family competence protein [Patescibacteria group bacterium]|nr:ComEC family competence protein [Patescibacteria group bacterium]
MQKDFFYVVLGGFAGGIFFRSFFDFGVSFSWLFIFLGIILFFFYLLKIKKRENHERAVSLEKILFLVILLMSVGLGMMRFDAVGLDKDNLALDKLVGEKVKMKAIVVDEPDVRENNTRLIIKFSDLGLENTPLNEKAIITTGHYPKFKYGDEINIFGELKKPKNFVSDDNREFDYISYLAKDRIYYQMFYPEVNYLSSGNGNFIKEKLFEVKTAFLFQIKKIIPEPHSSLLGGLVVGAKESLGKELQEDFRKTGLIHIVVLSGYNLTIVAEFMMGLFSFLPIVFSTLLGAVSIILFAIMTGASATIVRASVMALLVMLAHSTGRVNQMTRTLFLAGFLMLLHNPNILIFDPSFQLSFMATFGLIVLSPRVKKYFEFIPEKFNLRESLVAVISTQIFVLPLILYMMGDFSVVSIPVNLLVLMFIPLTMLLGFLTGIFGFISSFLAIPFAYATYGLLTYELKIVDIFASLPFSSFHISYFPAWLMVSIYGIYFIWLLRKKVE